MFSGLMSRWTTPAAWAYHVAYPALDGLAAPKTAQTLAPEDDVAAIVAAP